jgi:N-methylhydantoinase A
MIRIAADTGGTFTDVLAMVGGRIISAKVPSRPDAPDEAVAHGLRELRNQLPDDEEIFLTHGTTVGTNALLEDGGAETWLIVNRDFEDLLAIGRQDRKSLYDLSPSVRSRLVPARRTIGVRGRRDPQGEQLEALDIEDFEASLQNVSASSTERAWAVCLLHSYADGSDEVRIGEVLEKQFPGEAVTLSHEVMPEFREVERAGTTVANAHLAPLMNQYLKQIEGLVERVDIMGSAGGRHSVGYAAEYPVHTALSGPAGGVVAAMDEASRFGLPGVLSFDMGGTSTDVALCRGELPVRYEGHVGNYPLHVPMLDIHTVGAGGGSIAFVDAGGALRVGPESSGADPGPACYGKGERPTVTDANVVLGRIPADLKLAGSMAIYPDRAERAIEGLARELGVGIEEAAQGILDITVEAMAGAIRTVSVERGIDPRQFPLCAFGGAGGLHVCALAERLGISHAMVPGDAGLLSARGMLLSDPKVTVSATVLGKNQQAQEQAWSQLLESARDTLGRIEEFSGRADCRYEGQSFELSIPFDGDSFLDARSTVAERFEERHQERFGYTLDADIEVVTLRVEAKGEATGSLPAAFGRSDEVVAEFSGPKVISRMSTTIFVEQGWQATEYADETIELMRKEG